MISLSNHLVPVVVIIVSVLGLIRPKLGPISLYLCPGMVYGAAYPWNAGVYREGKAWIAGEAFGESMISPDGIRSIRRPMTNASAYPKQESLDLVAGLLLDKRWQDPSRAIEAEWKVKQPRLPPELVEDWHEEPREINIVEVQTASVGVFSMHYDVTTSTLSSHRIAWAQKSIEGTTIPTSVAKVGEPAPDFELTGTDGQIYRLSDFRGNRAVVIAWFPEAFTGGCTVECKSLRSSGEAIRKFDVAYFAASCDSLGQNRKFAEFLNLDFPVLSDPQKDVAKAYGVVTAARARPQRWTFYIGKDGNLLLIDKKVDVQHHGKDIATRLDELGIETMSPRER